MHAQAETRLALKKPAGADAAGGRDRAKRKEFDEKNAKNGSPRWDDIEEEENALVGIAHLTCGVCGSQGTYAVCVSCGLRTCWNCIYQAGGSGDVIKHLCLICYSNGRRVEEYDEGQWAIVLDNPKFKDATLEILNCQSSIHIHNSTHSQ